VNVTRFNSGSAIGILFAPNTDNTLLQVNNSYITANGIPPSTGGGIVAQPAVGGKAVVVISNSRITTNSDGVKANSASGIVVMSVRDSTLANNRGNGINATAGTTISLMVERNTINTNFQNGVLSNGANSLVRIFSSSIFGNVLAGVASAGGGAVRSYKNNAINDNVVDGTPITQEFLN